MNAMSFFVIVTIMGKYSTLTAGIHQQTKHIDKDSQNQLESRDSSLRQELADVEGFYRHHVRPEIGTYELAKQLRESKSRKSAVKTNSTVKVLAIVALLLIICLCLFMLVLN